MPIEITIYHNEHPCICLPTSWRYRNRIIIIIIIIMEL